MELVVPLGVKRYAFFIYCSFLQITIKITNINCGTIINRKLLKLVNGKDFLYIYITVKREVIIVDLHLRGNAKRV